MFTVYGCIGVLDLLEGPEIRAEEIGVNIVKGGEREERKGYKHFHSLDFSGSWLRVSMLERHLGILVLVPC